MPCDSNGFGAFILSLTRIFIQLCTCSFCCLILLSHCMLVPLSTSMPPPPLSCPPESSLNLLTTCRVNLPVYFLVCFGLFLGSCLEVPLILSLHPNLNEKHPLLVHFYLFSVEFFPRSRFTYVTSSKDKQCYPLTVHTALCLRALTTHRTEPSHLCCNTRCP